MTETLTGSFCPTIHYLDFSLSFVSFSRSSFFIMVFSSFPSSSSSSSFLSSSSLLPRPFPQKQKNIYAHEGEEAVKRGGGRETKRRRGRGTRRGGKCARREEERGRKRKKISQTCEAWYERRQMTVEGRKGRKE